MKPGHALLNANPVIFGEIYPNGRVYQVPPFQRNYSWTEDEWEDLWNDLIDLPNQAEFHYLGALVVREIVRGPYLLIDGQQRLATLSLLALAVISLIRELQDRGVEPENNKVRFDLLFNQFLGMRDPSSLRVSSRLQLNRADNSFYQTLIEFRTPSSVRNLRQSEQLLWQGYLYFQQRLRDWMPTPDGEHLSRFLNETVGRGLMFMEIRVDDDQRAYSFFETMNDRGLDLAPTDLVKNYLFSLLFPNDRDIAEAEEIWFRIEGNVHSVDFPSFLRHSIASRAPSPGRDRLFAAVKRQVPHRNGVFPLLRRLEEDSPIYHALGDPFNVHWLDFPGTREHLRVLGLFDVNLYRSLGLAAYHHLSASDFIRTLKIIAVVVLRFSMIGRRALHLMERVFNETAIGVSNGTIKSPADIVSSLAPVYVADDQFRADFRRIAFPERSQRKLVTYILLQLEAQITGKAVVDFESGDTTIEHILPENPGDGWESFTGDHRQAYTHRLGNLALLEPKLNRLAANLPIEEKAEIYAQSQFQLTRDAAKLAWNPAAIELRQDQLAKIATAAWRI